MTLKDTCYKVRTETRKQCMVLFDLNWKHASPVTELFCHLHISVNDLGDYR